MTVRPLPGPLAALVSEPLVGVHAYDIPHPEGIRVKLDANESPWGLPAEVAAELGAELARVELHRYPDGAAAALRDVVARQLGCAGDQLVFGNGSDELIELLIDAFARPRPGQERARVAYPVPSFVVYRIACLARDVAPVEVPLAEDFELDPDALDRAFQDERARPNLVFFALPNNPTGTLWPRDAIVRFLDRHPDVLVVADEAYFDYSGETYLDLLPTHPNLVVMRTLSKLGLAALRVGFLVAHPAIAREVQKIRGPYNVGALNQAAARWLLERHRDVLAAAAGRVVAERERVVRALASLPGLRVFPTRANFVLVRVGQPGDGRATATWEHLVRAGILVRSFDRPGPLAGCLRITIGTPNENDLLLEALRR